MTLRRLHVALILLAALLTCNASAETYYSRALLARSDDSAPLWAVALDAAVYQNAAADLSDLRIIDDQQQETAYLLQNVRETQSRSLRQISASLPPKLRPTGEQGLEIEVRLSDRAPAAQGFTIETEQHDFEYDIAVAGSDDGQHWQTLVEQARIYDYSRYMAVSNREVRLPDNRYRQFRISVRNAVQSHTGELRQLTRTLQNGREQQRSESLHITQQHLHIQRLEFWHDISQRVDSIERQTEYAPLSYEVKQDQNTTVVDIETQRQPLSSMQLSIATPHFNRAYELQANTTNGSRTLAQGRIEALHVADIQRDTQPIRFATQQSQHYRLLIHNQDNPPLQINAIRASGPMQQLVFLPQPARTYRLTYGATHLSKPRYDIAAIQELLHRQYALQSVSLDAATDKQSITPSASQQIARQLDDGTLLTVAISLMVVGLLWSLLRLGNKI